MAKTVSSNFIDQNLSTPDSQLAEIRRKIAESRADGRTKPVEEVLSRLEAKYRARAQRVVPGQAEEILARSGRSPPRKGDEIEE